MRQPSDVSHEIVRLRDDNEELRERIRQLEGLLHGGTGPCGWPNWPYAWHLTPHESILLGFLASRERVTTSGAMDLLYGMKVAPPDDNIIRVYIARLRRKLTPHGISIRTHWGMGWSIDAATRTRLKEISGSAS